MELIPSCESFIWRERNGLTPNRMKKKNIWLNFTENLKGVGYGGTVHMLNAVYHQLNYNLTR